MVSPRPQTITKKPRTSNMHKGNNHIKNNVQHRQTQQLTTNIPPRQHHTTLRHHIQSNTEHRHYASYLLAKKIMKGQKRLIKPHTAEKHKAVTRTEEEKETYLRNSKKRANNWQKMSRREQQCTQYEQQGKYGCWLHCCGALHWSEWAVCDVLQDGRIFGYCNNFYCNNFTFSLTADNF